jgi:hypothetical protein
MASDIKMKSVKSKLNSALRLISIIMVLFWIGSCIPKEEKKDKEPDMMLASLQFFKELQRELVTELYGSIMKGGTDHAVPYCKLKSSSIEKIVSQRSNIEIKRVTDRARNPQHLADAFEMKIIEKWKAELSLGKKPSPIAQKDEKGNYRVMEPIILKIDFCLKCHGSETNIKPSTLKIIKREYPKDNARGYKIGDLRGAFSATWKLDK